ncbi:PSP1 C-terminal conserved region containing protein [Novymonas esmeraldas]|uniref:PSP1 C-terminal conserved region containing protein n=1 Tax=Novymonas esmeraldas TaxID=1808958 RepID=A0AAW0EMM6_9TRYP
MATRPLPGPRIGATAMERVKATLTSDPQDLTEIPSLFQTFGRQDVSSSEDDEGEVNADTSSRGFGVRYETHEVAAASPHHDTAAYPASTHGPRLGGAVPGTAAQPTYRAGQGSLSSSRTRHPLNRSTHNPYVLLGSSDVNQSTHETTVMANSAAMRQRHGSNSYSNNTSQNPLTFEFASTSTLADMGPNALSASGAVRRPPSLHQSHMPQQHAAPLLQRSTEAPMPGYWRDGNPMALSSTDIRPVPTTTVGTLTSCDGEQNLNVNVKQRMRTGTGSTSCSLNASNVAMPVVQPVSPALTMSPAAGVPRHSSTITDATTPLSFGAGAFNGPRYATSSGTTSEERSQPGRRSPPVDRRTIAVPPHQTTAGPEPPALVQRRGAPDMSAPAVPSYAMHPQAYIHAQQLSPSPPPQQQHHQQQAYGAYGVPMPSSVVPHHTDHHPQQQQHQQHDHAYGRSDYHLPHMNGSVPTLSHQYPHHHYPSQYQQYYAAPVAHASGAGAHDVPFSVGGQQHPEASYMAIQQQQQQHQQHVQTAYALGSGSIISGRAHNRYAAMPPLPPHIHAPYGSHTAPRKTMPQRPASVVAGPHQPASPPAMMVQMEALAAAPVASSPHGRPPKVRAQHADPGQQPRNGAAVASTPADGSSPTGATDVAAKPGAPPTAAAPSPMSSSAKKLAKRQDDARFYANHDAPIRMFVVVKRKAEGQRYACALPPEEVPVGSHMLVEGDRGADLGEVLAHVSLGAMARDCMLVERLRQRAMGRMLERKAGSVRDVKKDDSGDDLAAVMSEADLPTLDGPAALEYLASLKTWPRVIGPATAEDIASLEPQREAEKVAFTTAKPIVQQFIENRYLQRVARNDAAVASAVGDADPAAAAEPAEQGGDHLSGDDGERRTPQTPLSADELKLLELSREVTLVDCEYQFTREKITLYVSRPSRSIFVDFRSMQRKLFRTFRCRIWIAYMDEVTRDKDAPEWFVFVPPPSVHSNPVPTKDDEAA